MTVLHIEHGRNIEGKHDWYGYCDPANWEPGYSFPFGTFSVGVFKWVPKSRKGIKKGSIILRVSGDTEHPYRVHQLAELLCDKLDKGWKPDKKEFKT